MKYDCLLLFAHEKLFFFFLVFVMQWLHVLSLQSIILQSKQKSLIFTLLVSEHYSRLFQFILTLILRLWTHCRCPLRSGYPLCTMRSTWQIHPKWSKRYIHKSWSFSSHTNNESYKYRHTDGGIQSDKFPTFRMYWLLYETHHTNQ